MLKVYFAGGCFWGTEYWFKKLIGVHSTKVGYMGGDLNEEETDYKKVCSGETGHTETVAVSYDSSILSLETLLRYFFSIHNPTTLNRQGNDVGSQYRSAIFVDNNKDIELCKRLASEFESSKRWGKPIVTEYLLANQYSFIKAEDEHQDYISKNPNGYNCHILHFEGDGFDLK